MKTLAIFVLTTTSLFHAGCGGPSGGEAFVQPPVGVLDTGDFLLTLHSSPEGPLYTVEDGNGEFLAQALTRAEFVDQFPELKEQISRLWTDAERGSFERTEQNGPVFEDLLGVAPQDRQAR